MGNDVKIIGGIVGLAILILGGIVAFSSHGVNIEQITAKNVTDPKIVRDYSHTTGTNTKVQLLEFGDYQCPACDQEYPILKQITTDYGDKVQFVFRNFPLPMHPNAQPAAMAAEAAGLQGKYWEMHDKLYEIQNDWADATDPVSKFVSYAGQLGLDTNKFKKDLTNSTLRDYVAQDMGDGNAIGVNATPTLYLNGKQITGGNSYENLKAKIDAALTQ